MKRILSVQLVLLSLSLGCGSDEQTGPRQTVASDPQRIAADHAALTAAQFGDIDPGLAVATVDGTTITAGDVATYLALYPTLTVVQAVEDLVDIHAGRAIGEAATDVDYRDARVRGRALAWLRTNVWSNPEFSTPDPATVDEMVADPQYIVTYGTPALATVTHVLFTAEDTAEQTPERAAAAEALTARVRTALSGIERPLVGTDLLAAVAETIPDDDPALLGMELYSDAGLTFPREFSGPHAWIGLDSVVPRFAEASFESPLNQLIGPVQSYYGWHLIIVESRTEADLPSDEEIRQVLEARDVRRQRGLAVQGHVGQLLRSTPVLTYEDNVGLLSLSAEERVRLEASARGDRFRAE